MVGGGSVPIQCQACSLVISYINTTFVFKQKPVSEQFALPTQSFDLPPIIKREKPKAPSVLETSADAGLTSLFDPTNTGSSQQ